MKKVFLIFLYLRALTALSQEGNIFELIRSTGIDKYSDIPNKEVGFKVVQQVFDTNDDVNLFDNQGAVPNQTAPGADRLKISLVLTTKDQITSTENFGQSSKIMSKNYRKVIYL